MSPSLPPSISIVFPAYNEEENIEKTVALTKKLVESIFSEWEIIVVNDGSRDRTGDIINQLHKEDPRIIAVHHDGNKGYGKALTSGFSTACKDLIFFCDSDLQFDINELPTFLNWIPTHDIVMGYRAKRQDPFHRLLNAKGWNILVRLILGLKVRDIDCAFKLFRREVFDHITIESVGAMVNTEILVQAFGLGFQIKELPVTHFPREFGTQTGANLRVILKAFKELFRLRRKLKGIQPLPPRQRTAIPTPAAHSAENPREGSTEEKRNAANAEPKS